MLSAGTYFAVVEQFSGNTSYTLSIAAIYADAAINADNSIGSARDIGTLTHEEQSFMGFVGYADQEDYYQFSLDGAADVSLRLEGLSTDADLSLIQDANGNGRLDRGEVIANSGESNASPESINSILSAGTYFALVEQFSGNTGYTLSVAAEDIVIVEGTVEGAVTGTPGADRFVLSDDSLSKIAIIINFQDGIDKIDLRGTSITSPEEFYSPGICTSLGEDFGNGNRTFPGQTINYWSNSSDCLVVYGDSLTGSHTFLDPRDFIFA